MRFKNVGTSAMLATLTAVLVSCAQSAPSGNVGRGPAATDAIKLTIEESSFQPDLVEMQPGEPLTIEITNLDKAPHDFAIPELGLNTGILDDGDVATAQVVLEGDTLEFVCTLHEGMEGTITR
ncbi:MAG: cupredoxin domain-containing protein [Actinomycetota bacterium]|nr:cupredoxin domain-containing protein [Actinomycetota bacterium]